MPRGDAPCLRGQPGHEAESRAGSSFARLAIKGIQQEYPNKPEHVLNSATRHQGRRGRCIPPSTAASTGIPRSTATGCWCGCCGCFPTCPRGKQIRAVLAENLTAKNLQAEADYFNQPNRQSFERTYGWAWLLKLAEELHGWDDPDGQGVVARTCNRLADVIVGSLPRVSAQADVSDPQRRPSEHGVRPGVRPRLRPQPWATSSSRSWSKSAAGSISARTRRFRPRWEPDGADFFSPSLMEADLMRRVLPPAEFRAWLQAIPAGAGAGEPKTLLTPATVADRSDPQIVHLDGLNLSRAWCMRSIAAALPEDDPARKVWPMRPSRHAEAALRTSPAAICRASTGWRRSRSICCHCRQRPARGAETKTAPGSVIAVSRVQPIKFQRHLIDNFPAGYQVAVADINCDGRLDVIALSTNADRVDWYENPSWKRHPGADGEEHRLGRAGLGWQRSSGHCPGQWLLLRRNGRGGEIQLLRQPAKADDPWQRQPIAVDPVVHRLRWGDLEGTGPVLVHAPIFGPGSQGAQAPKPAHLWAFRPPQQPGKPWETWKIDESLTVLHGIQVADIDGDGRDAIYRELGGHPLL